METLLIQEIPRVRAEDHPPGLVKHVPPIHGASDIWSHAHSQAVSQQSPITVQLTSGVMLTVRQYPISYPSQYN